MAANLQQIGAPTAAYAERHHSVLEIAAMWSLSNDAVRDLFKKESGVLVIGHDGSRGKRAYRTLRIPESVVQRVHRRMSRPDVMHTVAYNAHRKDDAMKPTARIGRPPKPPRLRKTRRIQLLLTPAEHRALIRYVQKRDTTASELIRAYIRTLIAQPGGTN